MPGLLPTVLDASERARPAIGAAFGLLTLVTLARRCVAHLLLPDGGAQSIATIPLETFGPAVATVPPGGDTTPRDLVIAFYGRTNDAMRARSYFDLDDAPV